MLFHSTTCRDVLHARGPVQAPFVCFLPLLHGCGMQADLHVVERSRHRLELLLQSSLLIGQPLI